MTAYKVVVDGSNVATEGRTRPSLAQLDEAVRSFIEEHPSAEVLVIVDSSFPNRIDPADVAVFEEAFLAGEIITPPAGTVGRGDAFILKVADKLGATVFSNDSFQEFHGTYEWLFEKGRLIGGKPIPGLGWVFTPRVPVRGQKSREAVREAKRQTVRVGSPEASRPMPVPKAPPPFLTRAQEDAGRESGGEFGDRRRRKKRRSGRDDGRSSSGEVMFDESSVDRVNLDPDDLAPTGSAQDRSKKRRGRGRGRGDADQADTAAPAINEPGVFLTFIASNLPGSSVDGVIDDYSSHGFYVTAGGARCYVPLSGLAEPTPRSAKEVVRRGETRNFIVKAFDAARRGIELALIGSPSAGGSLGSAPALATPSRGGAKATGAKATGRRGKAAAAASAVVEPTSPKPAGKKPTAKKAAGKKAAGKKAAGTKPVVPPNVEPVSATKVAPKKSPVKKAPAKNVAAKKAQVTEAPTKTAPTRTAPAKTAPAKTVGAKPGDAKKVPARRVSVEAAPSTPTPKKAPAVKASAKKIAVARSAPPTVSALAAANPSVSKKAPAKRTASSKAPATAAAAAVAGKKAPSKAAAKSATTKTTSAKPK